MLTDEIGGGARDTEIQVFALDLEPGDLSPAVLASRIVSTANRRTPGDDATAVVVRVHGEHDRGWL
jgi:hypothetical protein